jgi:hypothetical protein
MSRHEFSSLRQGLVFAACPSLGASGLLLVDRSGRNANGTLTNMGGQSVWQPVAGAPAVTFDGTNDFSVSSDRTGLSGNVPWSVAFWVYSSATSGTVLYSGGGSAAGLGILIRLSASGSMLYSAGTTNCTIGNAFDSGKWTHGVFVYPGTVIRETIYYKNGVRLGTVSESPVNAANVAANYVAQSVWLGSISGTGQFLNGSLDDVRVYNRALTPAEIRLLASRRGIGLQPLPDRAGGLPRKLSVNVGGTWRAADAYVNVGGAWKLAQAYANDGGTWK